MTESGDVVTQRRLVGIRGWGLRLTVTFWQGWPEWAWEPSWWTCALMSCRCTLWKLMPRCAPPPPLLFSPPPLSRRHIVWMQCWCLCTRKIWSYCTLTHIVLSAVVARLMGRNLYPYVQRGVEKKCANEWVGHWFVSLHSSFSFKSCKTKMDAMLYVLVLNTICSDPI